MSNLSEFEIYRLLLNNSETELPKPQTPWDLGKGYKVIDWVVEPPKVKGQRFRFKGCKAEDEDSVAFIMDEVGDNRWECIEPPNRYISHVTYAFLRLQYFKAIGRFENVRDFRATLH
jgi:hypothetical protein